MKKKKEKQKVTLIRNIIRIDKKIDGIQEVRDESDRENPVRIVVDLKANANSNLIANYLLKNTELQFSYNFNMVAIVNNRPMTLGILEILDAYIEHQKEIVTRKTKFDLDHAKTSLHIVDGLIKAISILDEIIKIIRGSKNKMDSKLNLINAYGFTDQQAESIVMMHLYKLSNTDVLDLVEEQKKLNLIINGLEAILNDPEKLKDVIKQDLRRIKNEYATPRLTEIKDEITNIKIDTTSLIAKEDVIVAVTKDGYVKRTSLRSYNATDSELNIKDGDYIIGMYQMNTMDVLLLFTDLGNYLYIPVYEIPDLKWKDLGKHISNIIKIMPDENIIKSIPVYDFDSEEYITLFTKQGMVKKTKLSEFKVSRYSKPMCAIKLKKDDLVVDVTNNNGEDVLVITNKGYALKYSNMELSPIGLKAAGVKSISLKDDYVVNSYIYSDMEYLSIITDKSTGKRIRLNEIEKTSRTRRGSLILRDVKTNPYHILNAFIINPKENIGLKGAEINYVKGTELPITDKHSIGSVIQKASIQSCFVEQTLTKNEEPKQIVVEEVEEVSLESVDKKIMTIDDFLDDFKI